MFSQKSLRFRFILQLVSASTMLIAIISMMLYYYIRITIFEAVVQLMSSEAKSYIENPYKFNPENSKNFIIKFPDRPQTYVTVINDVAPKKAYFEHINHKEGSELFLYYPVENFKYLKLRKDTTMQSDIVNQVLIDILFINTAALLLVLFYAVFLSRMLLVPIKTLSLKLSNLNEGFLEKIDTNSLPSEFEGLGASINKLIGRIQTFVLYQKELFVGTAHELKTPLAVMKTKNEVTLLKPRESEKYIEALRSNNEAIDGMNKMIGSILEIGRQEGAQFENPVDVDLIGFLRKLGNNFEILARQENKIIAMDLKPEILNLKLQPTLLTHVLQNFIQNAIKFSSQGSVIQLNSRLENDSFVVEVLDNGIGIDESKDLFAPFKRYGDKVGSGLGLFLAKGAAQALGGSVSIKNRTDTNGAIATLILPTRKKNRTK